MNRRDLLKGAAVATLPAVIPAAALVDRASAEGLADCARVVWVALCRGVCLDLGGVPDVGDYIESQQRQGRSILQVLEHSHRDALVVVEMRCGSMASAVRFLGEINASCEGKGADYKDHEVRFGLLMSIGLVGPGQIFNLSAFVEHDNQDELDGLRERIERLEHDKRSRVGVVNIIDNDQE